MVSFRVRVLMQKLLRRSQVLTRHIGVIRIADVPVSEAAACIGSILDDLAGVGDKILFLVWSPNRAIDRGHVVGWAEEYLGVLVRVLVHGVANRHAARIVSSQRWIPGAEPIH